MPEDMDIVRSSLLDQAFYNSITRGGPIYVPDLVGPITRAAEFEALAFEELESLRAEVLVDSSQVCEDHLSLDELKVFTEEELAERALEEAFKDDKHHESSSPIPEDLSKSTRKDGFRISSNNVVDVPGSRKEINNYASSESVNGPIIESRKEDCSGKIDGNSLKKKKRKKRGRAFDRNIRATELQGSYIAKVEQLAKIKQKQDEDKAAANLHSFNGSCKTNESSIQSLENIERTTSVRSITSTSKAKSSSTYGCVAVSYPEVVLCLEIYSNTRHYIKGDCKHTIVIRDMRLLHQDDVKNRAAYPVLTFRQKSRLQKCCVCRVYRASKVTVDDKWAQENSCYFCDNCYYLLHYNEDGTLLYHDFTVYDHHNE